MIRMKIEVTRQDRYFYHFKVLQFDSTVHVMGELCTYQCQAGREGGGGKEAMHRAGV